MNKLADNYLGNAAHAQLRNIYLYQTGRFRVHSFKGAVPDFTKKLSHSKMKTVVSAPK